MGAEWLANRASRRIPPDPERARVDLRARPFEGQGCGADGAATA
jgi:hypothetical protein